MKVINTTPHDVAVYKDGKLFKRWEPSGMLIRASEFTTPQPDELGVPTVSVEYGPPTGSEQIPKGATVFVSILVAEALAKDRPDLVVLVPDTGPDGVVRDAAGNILGCTRFTIW